MVQKKVEVCESFICWSVVFDLPAQHDEGERVLEKERLERNLKTKRETWLIVQRSLVLMIIVFAINTRIIDKSQ